MKLTLGFSPCPNDTFIFDALVHDRIDTGDLEFEVQLADVEALNQQAFRGELDVTKLSFHAFAHLTETYQLLDAGSALGNNCGPLLIAGREMHKEELPEAKIAIPGKYTTANFLLSLAYPEATNKYETVFSNIEQDVLDGKADAGLIIHENRFTFQEKGLIKIQDLGQYWEQATGMPIPLGGIVVRRDLPGDIKKEVNRLMAESVRQARAKPEQTRPYVRAHAQEMKEDVMYQHIDLYVNDYTQDLGDRGRAAVNHLFEQAGKLDLIPPVKEPLFVRG
jgi:1,4-dihydroxy-6-naphthoate synthase